MKILFVVARVLLGVLFVFSGLVKLNDPSGFSIKLDEYFDVFSQSWGAVGFFHFLKSISLGMSLGFCALEVILGLAILLGWNFKITMPVTGGLILFFTFLTFYSAYYHKVTDCGCFGDFLKLKPWHSFYKDLALMAIFLVLWKFKAYNRPFFSIPFGNRTMALLSSVTLSFGLYCYYFLPVWDFLPYKEGNDIQKIITHVPKGQRATDSFDIIWVLQKGNDSVKVKTAQYADYAAKGWQYKNRINQLVIEGYKSPIHDFSIYDPITSMDMKSTFLENKGYQLVAVIPYVEKVDDAVLKDVNELFLSVKKEYGDVKVEKQSDVSQSFAFYNLTASSTQSFQLKQKSLGLSAMDFYLSDQKMLLTMARYNPTIYLLHGAKVLRKWSGLWMPDVDDISEIVLKNQMHTRS